MPLRIDIPAFVGVASRGPIGRVVVIDGWPSFVATFGDFSADAFLAYVVRGFFDNGGQKCHVLRVAAPPLETQTAGPQPADRWSSELQDSMRVRPGSLATLVQTSVAMTQGVQPVDRRSSAVATVAGMSPGNRALLQQSGVSPVLREIVSVDAATKSLGWSEPLPAGFDLTTPIAIASSARDTRLVASISGSTVGWTRPLDGRFDLGKTIHLGFGAGVANGLLFDEQGDPLLAVQASNPGVWGNRLSIRLTTHFSGDYSTRQLPSSDPADRLSLDRVEGIRAGAMVEIAQEGAFGLRTLVERVDAAERRVVLHDPLALFDLGAAADGTKPIRLRRRGFNLSINEAGRLVEAYPNIDLPPIAQPDASTVNDVSRLIRIVRLPGPAGRWLDADSPMLARGELCLSGGRDGIAMLSVADFVGVPGLPPAGLALFDNIPEPAAIAMPDIGLPPKPARETIVEPIPEPDPCSICSRSLPPATPWPGDDVHEASPGFDLASIVAIQRAMVEHCEQRGDRLALLEPPLSVDGDCLDLPDLQRWREQFDSSYAASYHPWIDAADPLDRTDRVVRRIPPCGHALGQFARSDREPGRAAPANRELAFASGTACPIDDALHAMLNEGGLNTITARSGRGIRIMGARTMSSAPDWKQLTVRRLLIRLKRAMARELAWAVFEPANTPFETRVIATLEGLLELEWQAGRLLGDRPEEAFRIAIDRDAARVDNGEFVVLVGIAPSLPSEFIFLRLAFTLDTMNLAELTSAGGLPS